MKRLTFLIAGLLLVAPLTAQLAVTERAAISGQYGLEVQGDGTGAAMAVGTDVMIGQGFTELYIKWAQRFSDVTLAPDSPVDLMAVYDDTDTLIFALAIQQRAGVLELVASALDSAQGMRSLAPVPVGGGSHEAEVRWAKGPTGSLALWLDAVEQEAISDLDAPYEAGMLRFGAPTSTVAIQSGTWMALDDFSIVAPAQEVATVLVPFQAVAGDPEDGDLSAQAQWTSSLEGQVAEGAGPMLIPLAVAGVHDLTASITSLTGQQASDTVSITVIIEVVDGEPWISILQPEDGSTHR